MADNKNMELNDEMMAKASGGELDPWNETVVISGIDCYLCYKNAIVIDRRFLTLP